MGLRHNSLGEGFLLWTNKEEQTVSFLMRRTLSEKLKNVEETGTIFSEIVLVEVDTV